MKLPHKPTRVKRLFFLRLFSKFNNGYKIKANSISIPERVYFV